MGPELWSAFGLRIALLDCTWVLGSGCWVLAILSVTCPSVLAPRERGNKLMHPVKKRLLLAAYWCVRCLPLLRLEFLSQQSFANCQPPGKSLLTMQLESPLGVMQEKSHVRHRDNQRLTCSRQGPNYCFCHGINAGTVKKRQTAVKEPSRAVTQARGTADGNEPSSGGAAELNQRAGFMNPVRW